MRKVWILFLLGCASFSRESDIQSPEFIFRLDTSSGTLRADSWVDRRSGRTLPLKGPELEIDLDDAEQLIPITGWRCTLANPSDDFSKPDFDDRKWQGRTTPSPLRSTEEEYYWARTHLALPETPKPMSLVLGGVGLFDFRFMRVFLNGREVGTRRAPKRWNEPGIFEVSHVARPGDNVLALQLTGHVSRSPQLDQFDPEHRKELPFKYNWPAQFEQYVVVGRPLCTPELKVTKVRNSVVELEHPDISARVVYKSEGSVLRKFVTLTARKDLRLMNVRLGDYSTGTTVSEGEQGFPVYIDGRFFAAVAHPAGWAIGQDGRVLLRQYPGKRLKAGETFECMEVVLGLGGREAFLEHVQRRMRRVTRGHDKPVIVYEPFGGRPGNNQFDETEEHILDNLGKLAQGPHPFDYYSLEFWVDAKGDLKGFDPVRFPNGFTKIKERLDSLGIRPGLWIDGSTHWNVGKNPAIKPCVNSASPYGIDDVPALCRATPLIKSLYSSGFLHHLRENGARLLKFDGHCSICYNPAHDHLPGLYSTEAFDNGTIENLREFDQACPDVFIVLYWGYRSPWWLLYADTIFESGLFHEGSSPGWTPTLYARDGVIRGVDQAQSFCQDVPALGKDSLGVWLSSWGWNSSIGKERWQESFVMDMSRGRLLAQIWSDAAWLSPREREQLAEFVALLKEQPACFRNAKRLGDPWKDGVYGYSCSDGTRTFLAINNSAWSDAVVPLPKGDVYRWYPDQARLEGAVTLALRPFQVVLLEVVPPGEPPSLKKPFPYRKAPAFVESSRTLAVSVTETERVRRRAEFNLRVQVPADRKGGTLVVAAEMRRANRAFLVGGTGFTDTSRLFTVKAGDLPCTPVIGPFTWGACWRAWRVPIAGGDHPQTLELTATARVEKDVELAWISYFIPLD